MRHKVNRWEATIRRRALSIIDILYRESAVYGGKIYCLFERMKINQ